MSRELRRVAIAGAALILLGGGIAIGFFAGGGDPDGESSRPAETTLDAGGFDVRVPAEWEPVEDLEFPVAREVGADYVDDHVRGIDRDSWITAYALDREPPATPISAGNVAAFAPGLAETYRRISAALPEGEVLGEPISIEAAGLPGLQLEMGYRSLSGFQDGFRMNVLFTDTQVIYVGCNYSPPQREEMLSACDRAVASVEETSIPAGDL